MVKISTIQSRSDQMKTIRAQIHLVIKGLNLITSDVHFVVILTSFVAPSSNFVPIIADIMTRTVPIRFHIIDRVLIKIGC